MKLKIIDRELHEKKLDREINRFLGINGELFWREKVQGLKKSISNKKILFYSDCLIRRHPVLDALVEYFDLHDKNKSICKNASKGILSIAPRIQIINRIYNLINNNGKKRIKESLADDIGFLPFLYEIQIATHFLINDFDLEFVDLEKENSQESSYDFKISKGNLVGEIECKRISYDTGRNITRDGFSLLCDAIKDKVQDGYFLIEIVCDYKLGKNAQNFNKLTNVINEGIFNCVYTFRHEDFDVKIQKLNKLVIKNDNEAINCLSKYSNKSSYVGILSNEQRTLIISAKSRKEASVLNSIYKKLKEGSKQFSGKNPSLLAIYLENVKESELKELRKASGLTSITKKFFNNKDRNFINMVSYDGGASLTKEGNVYYNSAINLFYQNPNSKGSEKGSSPFMTTSWG